MFAVLAAVALVLKGVMLLVSYIANDSFPQPLAPQEEKYYLQMLSREMKVPGRFLSSVTCAWWHMW